MTHAPSDAGKHTKGHAAAGAERPQGLGAMPAADALRAPFDALDPRLDAWRVAGDQPVNLAQVDPAAKPLSLGSKGEDRERLAALSARLGELQEALYAQNTTRILVVLQGLDTSGKDGTIRAVFDGMDPLGVRAVSWKAPSDIERAHDYLWRIHQAVPAAGEVVIFNRSHYEDVLVPVVQGWITPERQQQRLRQIVDFERMLTEEGTVLIKCLLWISPEEQRERLQTRIDDPAKNWKFQMSDLDTRRQWPQYQKAYESLLPATSTAWAPWFVIPADAKTHRNLMVAELMTAVLERLNPQPPAARTDLAGLKVV